MQTLDYQVSPSRTSVSPAVVLLVALPIASAAYSFLSAANWVGEPFPEVELVDVILFVGAPVFALGSAVVWCVVARKRRLPWPVLVPVLAWFALMLCWSMDSLLWYFQEPWNT